MLDTSKVFEAISISLHVSFVSTLFAFLLSIFFGYLIATKKFILKKYVVSVLGSLTSIPPVCAGLIVYLIISRSGPLGWMELLYTPSAMIIAQFIIIFPIMVTLIINYIEREYPQLRDELISYGASQKDILFLLITNQKGIYAVGDICSYPGKLKLILSGFHEGALAARACFKLARPNEKYRFEFTTSSKSIKNRLGVKSD